MKVVKTYLDFTSLSERPVTDMIVIHHTGEHDIDASAEQIHEWHLANGWAGIGYHFVIRKNGNVEIGRPEWAIGSHAGGENSHTIGIHLSGDFQTAHPTAAQIEACAELVAELCRDYNIPIDRAHIVGHCDLMSTDCPGKNLYSRLNDIIFRAKSFNGVNVEGVPVTSINDLAERYEAEKNPAAIGEGYGLFQFTGATVQAFVDWLKNYPDKPLANYGRYLEAKDFDSAWTELGTVDPGHFGDLQREFAELKFYDAACDALAKVNFHADRHGLAMQAVIFARAVQHGVAGCVSLFLEACSYPNLSYCDKKNFDAELITAIYNYLLDTRPDLQSRWIHEMADALA